MLYRRLDNLQIKFKPIHHRVLRTLRSFDAHSQPLVLAISGGLDSVVLLKILSDLKPLLHKDLVVCHVHHGPAKIKSQKLYRDRAQSFVRKLTKNLNFKFTTNKPSKTLQLKSESDFRDFRYKNLEKVRSRLGTSAVIVLAHHQDDQLETQMMRLIRGTGLLGLAGMQVCEGHKLRPLLNISRDELEQFAKAEGLKWLDDPSNEKLDALRNWMRQEWLVQLEGKMPGAKSSLARSLSLIAEQSLQHNDEAVIKNKSISRQLFLALNRDQKATVIAKYLLRLNVRQYSSGQIREICRQLDNSRKEFNFTLLKHKWLVNAEQIRAKK